MSGQTTRLNVVPTVTMLGVVKARLIGTTRGHTLLKKKSDALTVQFHAILKKIVATKESMGEAMRASSFSLAEAKYVAGDGVRHVNPPLPIFPSAIPFLLLPSDLRPPRNLSSNRRRRDVGADCAPERGADGHHAGRRQGAAHRRDPRARAAQEEVGRAHRAVPRHPQEDRGHQGVHGRGHARLLLLARRGQVRGRRRRPPRRPPVRPRRLPPRPLPPGERRGGQAPQVLPLRRPRRRRRGRRLQRVPQPHRPCPRRPAGHRLPRRSRQGHRGARRARLPPDLLPHPRRGHQDHQPPRQRPRERRQAQAREHHHIHQGRARRARARGLLQAQEDPGIQEEGGRVEDERGQALRRGAARGGSLAQEGHPPWGRGKHTGWGRRQGRRHHLLISSHLLFIKLLFNRGGDNKFWCLELQNRICL